MTSKEYIEEHISQLTKDFDIAIKNNLRDYANKLVEDIKQSEAIKKDIEKLEQYEAIFKEPIMNIQKRLKVLEILKSILNASFLYLIKNEEDYNKVKEWLENDM